MIFEINSNDGWQKIIFKKSDQSVTGKNGKYMLFGVSYTAKYWSSSQLINDENYDLVLDKRTDLFQICLLEEKWIEFIKNAEEWSKNGKLFSMEFYNLPAELFRVSIGVSSDELISSYDKPVLEFLIIDSRSKLRFIMTVDRTSFRFIDEESE